MKFANLQTCDKKSAAKKCEAKSDVVVALHHRDREMSPNIKNADFFYKCGMFFPKILYYKIRKYLESRQRNIETSGT